MSHIPPPPWNSSEFDYNWKQWLHEIFKAVGTDEEATHGPVVFPATQITSDDANTLDDYEEGTWTPVLSDGTNNATATTAVGTYTKIGSTVHIKGNLGTSSLGSVTGNIQIDGLPFAANSTSNTNSSIYAGLGGGLNITSSESVTGTVAPSASSIVLRVWDASSGTTVMQSTEWSANGQLIFSGTYEV